MSDGMKGKFEFVGRKRSLLFLTFMYSDSFFHYLSHFFSPRSWLVVSVVSMVLAAGSGVVLLSRQGVRPNELVLPAYDWLRRFSRDTIRLTFKTDEQPKETVFVAPRGILNQEAVFKGVENFDDFVPPVQALAKVPLAPPQVLEPDWVPIFSGKKQEVDS